MRFKKKEREHAFDQEKKEEKTRKRSRKKVRNQDPDHAIAQEKKTGFKILLFFFYKFPPFDTLYIHMYMYVHIFSLIPE